MKTACSGLMGIFLMITAGRLEAQNFWQQVGSPGPYSINTLYVDSSDVLLAGTSNGVYRSTNDGSTWQSIGLSNAHVLMLKRFQGNLFACTFASGLYRSTNNGTSWSLVSGGLPPGSVYSIAVLGQVMYAALVDGIYKSTDSGTTWTVTGMTNPNQTIVVASPAGHLYAADLDALVYRSTDGGVSWTQILDGMSTPADLLVAPNGAIYLSLQSFFAPGVLRSTDGGATWQNVLPSVVSGWFAVNAAGHIFLSTFASGVYRTTDAGTTWQQVNSGLTNTSTQGIAINSVNRLFVGTQNGLVFRSVQPTVSVDHDETSRPGDFLLYQNYPNPFNPGTTIRFTLPDSRFTSLKVFNLLGQEVATLVNGIKQPGSYEVQWDAGGMPSGVYMYRLTAGNYSTVKKMLLTK
ncbi:MAG TPA: T9SS type A sorting domain-containing protein [Bacteroidota bacterium]|nr:T9SS type A sorting domain-containing protein [Bacteroidota bacterium]